MGKVDRLRNKVEPFADLFWALVIVLANTGPCPPARHDHIRTCLVQYSTNTCYPPPPHPFLFRYVIGLCATVSRVQSKIYLHNYCWIMQTIETKLFWLKNIQISVHSVLWLLYNNLQWCYFLYAAGCCDLARASTIEISVTEAWQGQEITLVITPKEEP